MKNTGNKDTRSGFGAGLYELGSQNPAVVALCADLTGSLKMEKFAEAYPHRFFQCGIAEANMMGPTLLAHPKTCHTFRFDSKGGFSYPFQRLPPLTYISVSRQWCHSCVTP